MIDKFVQVNINSPMAKTRPVGYIVQDSGCWQWTGSRNAEGYGSYWHKRSMICAHRFVYEQYKGKIPVGLVLDHLCRNTGCVNPEHLEPVVQRINVLRGNSPVTKQVLQTHCKNGHELVSENLVKTQIKRGKRMCRECYNTNRRKNK